MTTIGINDFVRRQTSTSEFTHFEGPLERVAELALEAFGDAKGSYHQEDGVRLVAVAPGGFFCGVVTLEEGDALVGGYQARQPGEEPRKELRVHRPAKLYPGPGAIERGERADNWRPNPDAGKSPCVAVDVVLYRKETLEAEGEACTGCDWDIIAINGRVTEEEQPIHPDTLVANHFGLDGGTPTKMNAGQFEAALKESVLFWKDKAFLVAPKG